MPALGVGGGNTKWEWVETGQVLLDAVATKRTQAPGHHSPHSSKYTARDICLDVTVSGFMAHYYAFLMHRSFNAHLSGG